MGLKIKITASTSPWGKFCRKDTKRQRNPTTATFKVAAVVPLLSQRDKLGLTLCDPMDRSTAGSSVLDYLSQSQLKSMFTESVMLSDHLILCHPLLLQSFPASGSFPMSRLFASNG